jgi:hypothetical protein
VTMVRSVRGKFFFSFVPIVFLLLFFILFSIGILLTSVLHCVI